MSRLRRESSQKLPPPTEKSPVLWSRWAKEVCIAGAGDSHHAGGWRALSASPVSSSVAPCFAQELKTGPRRSPARPGHGAE